MQAIEIYIYKDILITEKEVRIRDKACDFLGLKFQRKFLNIHIFNKQCKNGYLEFLKRRRNSIRNDKNTRYLLYFVFEIMYYLYCYANKKIETQD